MVELPEDCGWDMIVLDIDGTLLDRQGIIPEMIYLVRELERKGMVVSLASEGLSQISHPFINHLGFRGS